MAGPTGHGFGNGPRYGFHVTIMPRPPTTEAHFYVWLRGLRVGRRNSCNWLAARLTLPGSNATMTLYAPR
jgi:hypothetical protein